jgi:hypothetical protein
VQPGLQETLLGEPGHQRVTLLIGSGDSCMISACIMAEVTDQLSQFELIWKTTIDRQCVSYIEMFLDL